MAHKTLINGTAYEITGGKTLIDGTAYSIAGGKTLIGGTGYDISFGKWLSISVGSANNYGTYTFYYQDGWTWGDLINKGYGVAIAPETGYKTEMYLYNDEVYCTFSGTPYEAEGWLNQSNGTTPIYQRGTHVIDSTKEYYFSVMD